MRNPSIGLGVSLSLDDACVVYMMPAVLSLQDRRAPQEFSGPLLVRWLRYLLYAKVYLGQADLLQRWLIVRATQSFVFSQNMRRQWFEADRTAGSQLPVARVCHVPKPTPCPGKRPGRVLFQRQAHYASTHRECHPACASILRLARHAMHVGAHLSCAPSRHTTECGALTVPRSCP